MKAYLIHIYIKARSHCYFSDNVCVFPKMETQLHRMGVEPFHLRHRAHKSITNAWCEHFQSHSVNEPLIFSLSKLHCTQPSITRFQFLENYFCQLTELFILLIIHCCRLCKFFAHIYVNRCQKFAAIYFDIVDHQLFS